MRPAKAVSLDSSQRQDAQPGPHVEEVVVETLVTVTSSTRLAGLDEKKRSDAREAPRRRACHPAALDADRIAGQGEATTAMTGGELGVTYRRPPGCRGHSLQKIIESRA